MIDKKIEEAARNYCNNRYPASQVENKQFKTKPKAEAWAKKNFV